MLFLPVIGGAGFPAITYRGQETDAKPIHNETSVKTIICPYVCLFGGLFGGVNLAGLDIKKYLLIQTSAAAAL